MRDSIPERLADIMTKAGLRSIRCVAAPTQTGDGTTLWLTGVTAQESEVAVKVVLQVIGPLGIADVEIRSAMNYARVNAILRWRVDGYAADTTAAA
jgi:hypothetical protein